MARERLPGQRVGRLTGPILLLFAAPTLQATVCGVESPRDPCLGSADAQAACFASVQEDPRGLGARLALCEALLNEGDLVTAAIVVHEGVSRCSSSACRETLRSAEQALAQARVARDRSDPLAAERALAASRRRCTSGLSGDRSVAACEALLLDAPADLALYDALVRKLLKRGEPVRAFDYVLQARTAAAAPNALAPLFTEAAARRDALVEDCLAGDSLSLCNVVYVAGATDEGQVLLKTGELLLAQGERKAAREALLAAQALLPEEPSLARALAVLDRPHQPRPAEPQRPPEVPGKEATLVTATSSLAGETETVETVPGTPPPVPRNAIDARGRVH